MTPFKRIIPCVLALCLLAAPAAAAELTYSNFFPPTHVQSQLAEAWCQAVDEATGGELKLGYFPGGTLTRADQAFDGVLHGISDAAMVCLAYTRGRFPVLEVMDLPLGYPSGAVATTAANAFFAKTKPAELGEVEVMYLHAHGPGILFTKDRKVEALSQMKGLKIRATGVSARLALALGSAPVAMPMPEAYQALARGVVDGSLMPMESADGWKLAEVLKNCTLSDCVAYTTVFAVIVNKARWQALSEKSKAAVRRLNAEFAAKAGRAWDAADEKGRAAFLALPGRGLVELSAEEQKAWQSAAAPVLADYVKQAGQRGLDGKAILAVAREEASRPTDK